MKEEQHYKYFMYSRTQAEFMKAIEEGRVVRRWSPKNVIFNGQKIPYTEILIDPNLSKYSDAKIVAQGDIRELKYNLD